MARYRLTADAFLEGARRHKGEIITWDGKASRVMEALDTPQTKAVKTPVSATHKSAAKA